MKTASRKTAMLSTFLLYIVLYFTDCHKGLNNLDNTLSGSNSSSTAKMQYSTGKPNIILFLANDVGYEVPTFTGGHSYQTPTLDMMASNGIFFTHTYYCPGSISPHIDHTTLIDFTDFLPTIADLTGTPKPATYGILEGVSFADDIRGTVGANRSWVFCHWDNDATKTPPVQRWVNDTTYKLSDTLNYTRFLNMVKDTFERSPIPDNKLTPQEKQIKQSFISVLHKMHN